MIRPDEQFRIQTLEQWMHSVWDAGFWIYYPFIVICYDNMYSICCANPYLEETSCNIHIAQDGYAEVYLTKSNTFFGRIYAQLKGYVI